MYKCKKILAMLICVAMALAVLPGLTVGAETADGFEYELYIDHVEITRYYGDEAEVNIPSEIYGLPVTGIDAYAFTDRFDLTNVTIPASITIIDEHAFLNCYSTNIEVAETNTEYKSIDGVLFNKAGTVLINYPGYNERTVYTIPDSVVTICDQAFGTCRYLENVIIPDSVTSIGRKAFAGFSLKSIEVAGNNPNYKSFDGVLFDKAMTELIQYPPKNERTTYSIPDGITHIGNQAFFSCSNLITLTLPSSVTSMGDQVFYNWRCFTNIEVDNGNPNYRSIDGVLFNKDASELIQYPIGSDRTAYEVPDGTINIGDCAFSYCNLTSVSIPDSVINIGSKAFEASRSLAVVIMGSGISYIEYGAFSAIDSLTDVYYSGSESEWNKVEINEDWGNEPLLFYATIHYNSSGAASTDSETVPGISVLVNGSPISFDVPPTAIDGTTMLPVRLALEPLGAEFVWDGDDQTVTIYAKGKIIVLTIDSDIAYVDSTAKTMAKPAMAIDGRTLIPIRFVAEELGYDVDWDGDTSTVIING